jgi:hypothetical protein
VHTCPSLTCVKINSNNFPSTLDINSCQSATFLAADLQLLQHVVDDTFTASNNTILPWTKTPSQRFSLCHLAVCSDTNLLWMTPSQRQNSTPACCSITPPPVLLASHQLSTMTMASHHHHRRHLAASHRRRLMTASHRRLVVAASHRSLLLAASHRSC